MTRHEALGLLLKEYPYLNDQKVTIIKQFTSSNGRIYNTFLVESKKKGFEKFIAKGFVHHPENIKREWILLKLLQEKNALAPRLLDPDHGPNYFLLLEFIDGQTAGEAINEGYDKSQIFRQIGETTGFTHTFRVNHFGSFLETPVQSWEQWQLSKLENKKGDVKKLLDVDTYNKVERFVEETKTFLTVDSEGPPILVHHDIYLDNFILDTKTNRAILIDYGIAFGGRPFFDLAKFYIWDLYRYPKQKKDFFSSYSKYVSIPENFDGLMKFYILRECFGMISFFHNINDKVQKAHALKVLKELVNNEGVIAELLT